MLQKITVAVILNIVVFSLFSVLLTPQNDPPASAAEQSYHFIRAIAIDPKNPEIFYVATDNQGLIKSMDGGSRWKFINNGIKTELIYDVKVSLVVPHRVYAAAWGAGFYQSDDGGESWREVNDGLDNTAVGVIVLQADQDKSIERIYIGTSTDLYERRADETIWRSITDGLSFSNSPQFQSLATVGFDPSTLWVGTEQGLHKKVPGTPGWTEVEAMRGKRVTALMSRPHSLDLFAGTVNSGGIYLSRDQGASWTSSGTGLDKVWIRALVSTPSEPKIVYAATSGLGILKSRDAGRSWEKINTGLTDLDVRALSVSPQDANILFAGMHGAGLFKSVDAGGTWLPMSRLPYEPLDRQLAMLDAQSKGKEPKPAPPAAFRICNRCHGWTDPNLNQKPTPWRVAANERDWRRTVARMSDGAGIRSEDLEEILTFLENYTRKG
ncbi:MAG: hypothetical protein HY283_07560 [Nitrospirae bacterium]|nr:hypothetical protein [Nitrospirota bacterium]